MRAQLTTATGAAEASPSINDFLISACALALRESSKLNGAYRTGRFELHDHVNIGLVVAAPAALIVPTIFDADHTSLTEIATQSRALIERARNGTITPAELAGGTFTVSNLGMHGIRSFKPVINPPQAAILGVGGMERRAVVHQGELASRTRMIVTLCCDHRIVYGADAAEFLYEVRRRLEQPLGLLI
ncbi:MAG TPA: 2-oxo acid dehydrogenase subunit E2 [Solirubrobacteraceae bacterium]|jgi:pyruvate dehydrogenase E2 component (dihydrolipoamide acetyltransferase)